MINRSMKAFSINFFTGCYMREYGTREPCGYSFETHEGLAKDDAH